MAKRSKETSKLIVKKTDFPTLSGDEVGVKTNLTKGAVQFTSISFPLDYAVKYSGRKNDEDSEAAGVALKWQGYTELSEDHGFSEMFQVLFAEFGYQTSDDDLEKLSNEIAKKIGKASWSRVEKFILTLDKESGHRTIFIQAVWTEIFAEPFEELWLASMAQHAYYVLEDDFAFGYLTALLDQKRNIEPLFLRGKKNLVDSKLGGKLKPSALNSKTAEILGEMERLISNDHTISSAASLTFGKGFGSSIGANRKLWARHSK